MLNLRHESKEVQTLLEVLLNYTLKSEKLSPMGGIYFLNRFLGNKLEEDITKFRTKSDVIDLIKDKNFDSLVEKILLQCLDFSSSDSSISVKKSNNEYSYVELIQEQVFEVKSLLKKINLRIEKPRVVCIDGYIENISEIHHLLTDLSEKKENCIAFVRGMSEDVLHTLKVNIDRKTVFLYPFMIPFDVDNVNTLVDISVSSGTDIVTSLKGDLISRIKYENLGSLESCTTYGDVLRIRPTSKNEKSLQLHVDALKKKVEERRDLEEILCKRLKSLNSSRIEVTIPDDINFYSRSQQLDEGIRLISSIINNTYDPSGVSKKLYDSFLENISNTQTFLL